MKALILAGSSITVTEELKALCHGVDLVVAADSGLRHARPLEVTPDLIVGDFDSVAAEDLELYPTVPREKHPVRKDALDLELALDEAAARGANTFLIVGALGGRLDQTLAALFIAAKRHATHPGTINVMIHDGHRAAYPLKPGDVLNLNVPSGTPFSVLSLDPLSRVSLSGASYPLTEARLPFGVGLGVSNEVATSPLSVTLHEGSSLLLLELNGAPETHT